MRVALCDYRSVAPNPWLQILYLGGFRPVPTAYRDWLQDIVSLRRPRVAGALLALPNVAVLFIVGVLLALIGDLTGFAIFVGASVVGVAAGAAVTPFARRRARAIASKNGLIAPIT
jgi:hypothetical protein